MVGAVLYILYCGIADRFGPLLFVALGLVLLECAVFVGYGMKCPLTSMAQEHGAKKGYVFDQFIPEKYTRLTVPTFGTLLALGILLLFYRIIT